MHFLFFKEGIFSVTFSISHHTLLKEMPVGAQISKYILTFVAKFRVFFPALKLFFPPFLPECSSAGDQHHVERGRPSSHHHPGALLHGGTALAGQKAGRLRKESRPGEGSQHQEGGQGFQVN